MSDELIIPITATADTSGFRQTDQAAQKTVGMTKRLSQAFAAFGLAMAGVKQAIGMVTSALSAPIDVMDKLVEAYTELDRVTQKYAASVADFGGTTGPLAKAQLKAIETQSIITGRTTDSLTDMMSILNSTLSDAGLSTRAMTVALDAMASGEVQERQITEALSKAKTGNVEILQRVTSATKDELEAIRKLKTPREREIAAIQLLESRYGGLRGQMNQGIAAWNTMKNSIGDAVEEMGKWVLENKSVQTILKATAIVFRQVVAITGTFIDALVLAATGMSGASKSTLSLSKAFISLMDVTGLLGEIMIRTVGAARIGWEGLSVAINGIIYGTMKAAGWMAKGVMQIGDAMASHFQAILEGVTKYLPTELIPGFVDDTLAAVKDMRGGIKQQLEEIAVIGKGLDKTWEESAAAFTSSIQDMNTALETHHQKVNERKSLGLQNITAIEKELAQMDQQRAKLEELGSLQTKAATQTQVHTASVSILAATYERLVGRMAEVYQTGAKLWDIVSGAEDSGAGRVKEAWVSGIKEGDNAERQAAFAAKAGATNRALQKQREYIKDIGTNMAQIGKSLGSDLGAVFGAAIVGAQSLGDGLLTFIGGAIQKLAGYFSELLLQVALGSESMSFLGIAGMIAASIALAALSAGIGAIMSGGGSSGGSKAAARPLQAALRDEREQDDYRNAPIVVMSGLWSSKEMAMKAGEVVREAQRMGLLKA